MTEINRSEFLARYVLGRTSHKKEIKELIEEAEYAWDKITRG